MADGASVLRREFCYGRTRRRLDLYRDAVSWSRTPAGHAYAAGGRWPACIWTADFGARPAPAVLMNSCQVITASTR
jgi:hypothetical protein